MCMTLATGETKEAKNNNKNRAALILNFQVPSTGVNVSASTSTNTDIGKVQQ